MIKDYPHELLWEFTLKCNKNCLYCGSKDVLNKSNESKFTHEHIANQIVKVHPDEVTITGGEPSVEFDELVKCVKILKEADINVKILTNGNLFKISKGELDPYISQYGFSVNTEEDLNQEFDHLIPKEKTTIITNFGKHNFNIFNKIVKYAAQFSCWQVQLTIGNKCQLDLYEIQELQEKVKKVQQSDIIPVFKADNFNCENCCSAGIHGFSITYDGMIIPCLSYRSWRSDLMIEGDVDGIEQIWKNGFKFNRERKFVPSCKTISGIEKLNDKSLEDKLDNLKHVNKDDVMVVYGVTGPMNDKFKVPRYFKDHISVYGVVGPFDDVPPYYNRPITVYGVTGPSDFTLNDETDEDNKKV